MFQHTIQITSGAVIGIWSSMDLSSVKLRNIPFDGAVFSRSLLQNSNFAGCNLQKTSFVNAVMKDSDFSGCNLENASFCSAILVNVDLTGAKLCDVDFSFANIQYCHWNGYVFSNCNFTHAEFHHCTLTNTQYPQTELEGASFYESPLDHTVFNKSLGLKQTAFSDCSLVGTDFTKALLIYVCFRNCDLTGSFFNEARLGNVAFCGGTFKHIDFEHVAFAATDLTQLDVSCNLSHMKFLPLERFSPP